MGEVGGGRGEGVETKNIKKHTNCGGKTSRQPGISEFCPAVNFADSGNSEKLFPAAMKISSPPPKRRGNYMRRVHDTFL